MIMPHEKQITSGLVSFEELKQITGYKRSKAIASILRKRGIKFFYGSKNTIWTTIDLINAADGGNIKKEFQNLRADDIV